MSIIKTLEFWIVIFAIGFLFIITPIAIKEQEDQIIKVKNHCIENDGILIDVDDKKICFKKDSIIKSE